MTAGQYGAPQGFAEPRPLGGDSYRPLVAPYLRPNEQVHAVLELKLSDLIRRVPRKHQRGKPGPAALLGLMVLLDLVAVVVEAVYESIFGFVRNLRRLFRGRGLRGGWTSQAGQFVLAVRHGSGVGLPDNDGAQLVLAGGRTVIFKASHTVGVTVLGELPHGQLRKVELRHTAMSDRVDLHFADGSLAAIEMDAEQARVLAGTAR
ncbi:hypothetical protein ACIRPK_25395 [Kitasatospora sp. NPDC101801]|uniref:hypothetical protein n=1 Tax=Kitasatospora sp. NPDC101801 TaxID=3364103 RepID=UPI0037FF12AD